MKLDNVENIKYIIEFTNKNNIPLSIVGNGSNLLVKDNGIRGIVLRPMIDNIKIEEQGDNIFVTVGAGVPLPKLAIEMGRKGYAGLEFAAGIPGSIGGAIRMNAGAYGSEMKNIVISTTYVDLKGNIKTIENKEHEFEYRKSIFTKNKSVILYTKLKLHNGNKTEIEKRMKQNMQLRKEKQPVDMPSAGSTFKRQDGIITSKLIDEAGLKGFCIGDAMVSIKHAGFVVNKGNATAKEVLNLIKYIQDKIYENFSIKIETEIEIMGE